MSLWSFFFSKFIQDLSPVYFVSVFCFLFLLLVLFPVRVRTSSSCLVLRLVLTWLSLYRPRVYIILSTPSCNIAFTIFFLFVILERDPHNTSTAFLVGPSIFRWAWHKYCLSLHCYDNNLCICLFMKDLLLYMSLFSFIQIVLACSIEKWNKVEIELKLN